MDFMDIILTMLFAYIVGYVVTKLISRFMLAKLTRTVEHEAERVQDYILNKSRYFYVDEVDSSNGKLLLVYDYLDHTFVMQGLSKDELKDKLTEKFKDKDLYFVNKPAVQ